MLIFILFISLLNRLLFLFWGMPSLTFDEADFYYNAYLLTKTGSEIFGQKFFLTSGILFAAPSVPIYISSLFWNIFPKTIFFARLPFALINSLTPVVFYLLVLNLGGNKVLAALTALVLSSSSWFSHLSATAGFDAPLSLLFIVFGFYILSLRSKSRLKILTAIISWFLAFNSYMGIRAVFLPTILLFIFISNYQKKLVWKNLVKSAIFASILFCVFLGLSLIAPNSQMFKNRAAMEINFLNRQKITGDVWYARHSAQGNSFIKTLLFNKFTLSMGDFLDKYFESFNLRTLFIKGDPHPIYGTYVTGQFPFIAFVFFIIGLLTFRKTLSFKLQLFLLLLFVSGLSTALSVNYPTIALRAIVLLLPYSLLIASGIYFVINKYQHRLLFLTIAGVYLAAFFHFFLIYQTKIKVLSSEQWHLSDRLLVEKIAKYRGPVRVFTNEPKELFLLYNFYNQTNPVFAKQELQSGNNLYRLEKLTISDNCPERSNYQPDKNTLVLIKYQYCETPDWNKYLPIELLTSKEGNNTTLYYVVKTKPAQSTL